MFKQLILVAFVAIVLQQNVRAEDEMSLQVTVIEPPADLDEQPHEDVCASLKCQPGERCVIENGVPTCDCIDSCEYPQDDRQRICSTANKTYNSDCHFLQQKCWCARNDEYKCPDEVKSIADEKLDYYGECRYIEQCTDEQKQVFPSRMKIWLDEVLHILNKRKDLDPRYLKLVKLADEMKQNQVEKYWTAGVIFEFCALDKSKDHKIQKDELKMLISSIKALESCISPFLDECDKDGNDIISDDEWGNCLDLSPSDLKLLREKC